MPRLFDHIDLRVHDLRGADAFYRELLPALGFPSRTASDDWVCYEAEEGGPSRFIALIEDREHRPGATRIAFWKEDRAELKALGPLLHRIGAQRIEGPEDCPEYSPTYYAVFFEDPSGNRLEVCCRTPETADGASGGTAALWEVERRLWLQGADAYRKYLDEEALMVFAGVGVLRREQILTTIQQAPRWQEVTMRDQTLASFGDAVVVLAYAAEARRTEGTSYRALCSSTYRKHGDAYTLVQHQQTPFGE
jgi:catechol 2,3-dioxygenase-like lactoylglutathione lyase family enzyme